MMDALYRDPRLAGSFGGVEAVRRYSKKSRKDVKKHLASVDAYTLHKPLRTSFLRRRTYSKGIADLAQVDLVGFEIRCVQRRIPIYSDVH